MALHAPTYHNVDVTAVAFDGTNLGKSTVHYIEAGDPAKPTFLLLHGFPSSSTQFRGFIPLLSDKYHILASDFPGFGLTKVPNNFTYTFDNLAAVTEAWLKTLNITSYAAYMFDYGSPVGMRLALRNPESVKAIVTQNGNAYDAGFGHPFWDPIFALWGSNNSASAREVVRDNILTLGGTVMQYTMGVPEKDLPLVDLEQPTTDYLQNIAGEENQEHQLALFYDYRTNKQSYPTWHEYFRKVQPPLLAVWGKNDPAFIYPGAEAYKTDLPKAEVVLLDAGHFALETKRWEIAEIIKRFFDSIGFQ